MHAKPNDTAESDGNSDDSHYSINELDNDNNSDGQDSDLDDTTKDWGNQQWEALEEQQLLAWHKEEKLWK